MNSFGVVLVVERDKQRLDDGFEQQNRRRSADHFVETGGKRVSTGRGGVEISGEEKVVLTSVESQCPGVVEAVVGRVTDQPFRFMRSESRHRAALVVRLKQIGVLKSHEKYAVCDDVRENGG